MTNTATPPKWAEVLLRAFLTSRSFESVSGDLLEEYRESVVPARGRGGADLWYVSQVLGYGWRNAGAWATLFALAFVARTAMDWRVPTTEFQTRSMVSTTLGVGILLLAGFWAGSRSGSSAAGAILGIVTASLAVPLQIVGAGLLLAVWHDPITLSAIRGSGGLEEVFTMPLLTVLPGILLAGIGGLVGARTNRVRSA